jgi:hypothetical protein
VCARRRRSKPTSAPRLPAQLANRGAWASDLQLVLAALRIEPSESHICAVLAVTEQESTFRADPPVPKLAQLAREEIFSAPTPPMCRRWPCAWRCS